MSQKKKIVITALVSSTLTFMIVVALYLTIGGGCFFLQRQTAPPPNQAPSVSSALLSEVKTYLDAFYMGEIDEDKLYYEAAKGMANSTGDTYTKYYTPEEFSEYMDAAIGKYVGVGLVISQTTDTNEIIVVLPYEDAPGDKAGILPGDIIVAIDGSPVSGDMLDSTAELMRGKSLASPEGTKLTLKIKREGTEPFDVVLTREEVRLKTVNSKMIEGDIGYIRIISFDSDTDVELEDNLNMLIKSGMKKLILDLRDNGGGDFDASLRAAGKFLDEGSLMVYTQNKSGKRQDFYAEGKISDCEIILLLNGQSASASEVLTGALSGNARLRSIVGTKSFGKGITQNIYQLK